MKKVTVISRKEAKAKGMKTYFTGTACINGHVAERRVVNYECTICEYNRKSRKTKAVVETVKEVKKMIRMVVFSPYSRRGCPEIVVDKMIAA